MKLKLTASHASNAASISFYKSTLSALAGIAMFGVLTLTPTTASAYTSMADCESSEGVGKCSACSLGAGDGGYHRSAACASIALQNPNLFREVKAAEAAKVKQKSNCETRGGVWDGGTGKGGCTGVPGKGSQK